MAIRGGYRFGTRKGGEQPEAMTKATAFQKDGEQNIGENKLKKFEVFIQKIEILGFFKHLPSLRIR